MYSMTDDSSKQKSNGNYTTWSMFVAADKVTCDYCAGDIFR